MVKLSNSIKADLYDVIKSMDLTIKLAKENGGSDEPLKIIRSVQFIFANHDFSYQSSWSIKADPLLMDKISIYLEDAPGHWNQTTILCLFKDRIDMA